MNLLDKASIILTPTAYNNGEALCVKPSDGSGDFDFSRNSAATRVNAQGLVEDVQILSSNLVQNGDFSELGAEEVSNGSFSQQGSELIVNGDFATDSDWSKGSGWSISGALNAAATTSTAFQINTGIVSGKTYKVTYTISNYVSGSVRIELGSSNVSVGTIRSANGTYTEYIVALGDETIYFDGIVSFTGSIDNVSVVEVGQNWTFGTGWSVGEDKAVSDGTINTSISQSNVFTIGKSYKVTISVNDVVGSLDARFWMGTGGDKININSQGDYTAYWKADGTELLVTTLSSNTATYSITNISVKEVGQNWDLQTGWSIGDNVAVCDGTNGFALKQTIPALTIGKTYRLTFDIVDYTSGTITAYLPFGTANLGTYSSGTHTITTTITSTPQNNVYFRSNNFNGSITNISVIEITDDTNLPRINYEGFSYQDALGSELVTNGDFATDSNWIKASGVTISGGMVNAPSGSSGNIIRQSSITLDINKTYRWEFTISNYVNGSIKFASFDASVQRSANGTYITYSKPNGTGVNNIVLFGTFEGSIDNVSVKEVLGQEVVPDSGCGSWLFEPQTTQLIPYSEDFSNSSWKNESIGTTPILDGGYLAPDGTNNAFKISNVNQDSFWYTFTSGIGASTSRSIYARTVSGTGTAQLLTHNSNTNNTFTITEQWQRFEINNVTSTIGQSSFYAVDFRGSGTLSEVILWGANATNDQDYATSYIPSNGTSVTRNQDVCINGGSVSTINSTQGVLYAEIAALDNELTYKELSVSDGTSSNRIEVRYLQNKIEFTSRIAGASEVLGVFTPPSVFDFNKIALCYNGTDFKLYVNGSLVSTDTSINTFPANTFTSVQFNSGAGASIFYGKTKALAVWKEALSDEELTLLTTI